jgi:hypothetical protein
MFQLEHWNDLQSSAARRGADSWKSSQVFQPEHWSGMCFSVPTGTYSLMFRLEHWEQNHGSVS